MIKAWKKSVVNDALRIFSASENELSPRKLFSKKLRGNDETELGWVHKKGEYERTDLTQLIRDDRPTVTICGRTDPTSIELN